MWRSKAKQLGSGKKKKLFVYTVTVTILLLEQVYRTDRLLESVAEEHSVQFRAVVYSSLGKQARHIQRTSNTKLALVQQTTILLGWISVLVWVSNVCTGKHLSIGPVRQPPRFRCDDENKKTRTTTGNDSKCEPIVQQLKQNSSPFLAFYLPIHLAQVHCIVYSGGVVEKKGTSCTLRALAVLAETISTTTVNLSANAKNCTGTICRTVRNMTTLPNYLQFMYHWWLSLRCPTLYCPCLCFRGSTSLFIVAQCPLLVIFGTVANFPTAWFGSTSGFLSIGIFGFCWGFCIRECVPQFDDNTLIFTNSGNISAKLPPPKVAKPIMWRSKPKPLLSLASQRTTIHRFTIYTKIVHLSIFARRSLREHKKTPRASVGVRSKQAISRSTSSIAVVMMSRNNLARLVVLALTGLSTGTFLMSLSARM